MMMNSGVATLDYMQYNFICASHDIVELKKLIVAFIRAAWALDYGFLKSWVNVAPARPQSIPNDPWSVKLQK